MHVDISTEKCSNEQKKWTTQSELKKLPTIILGIFPQRMDTIITSGENCDSENVTPTEKITSKFLSVFGRSNGD